MILENKEIINKALQDPLIKKGLVEMMDGFRNEEYINEILEKTSKQLLTIPTDRFHAFLNLDLDLLDCHDVIVEIKDPRRNDIDVFLIKFIIENPSPNSPHTWKKMFTINRKTGEIVTNKASCRYYKKITKEQIDEKSVLCVLDEFNEAHIAYTSPYLTHTLTPFKDYDIIQKKEISANLLS